MKQHTETTKLLRSDSTLTDDNDSLSNDNEEEDEGSPGWTMAAIAIAMIVALTLAIASDIVDITDHNSYSSSKPIIVSNLRWNGITH